jgi:uncharacterized protein
MSTESTTDSDQESLCRRKFLKRGLAAAAGLGAAGLGYTLFEAGWLQVRAMTISVPQLPRSFQGTTIAFLSDIHHGRFTGIDYIDDAVRTTNALSPDLVLLGGDYTHRTNHYAEPCMQALGRLKSRLGTYGVMGNHDHYYGIGTARRSMTAAGIVELTNEGVWLERRGERLRIAGVGDLWEDEQDLAAALADTQPHETSILVSHNPDFVEGITDRRVGLVLSGHTHGGQVVLPVVGAPLVPSRYGQKYLYGLVKTPDTQVYVTRGVGTVTPPVRFCCRPEIALITIT